MLQAQVAVWARTSTDDGHPVLAIGLIEQPDGAAGGAPQQLRRSFDAQPAGAAALDREPPALPPAAEAAHQAAVSWPCPAGEAGGGSQSEGFATIQRDGLVLTLARYQVPRLIPRLPRACSRLQRVVLVCLPRDMPRCRDVAHAQRCRSMLPADSGETRCRKPQARISASVMSRSSMMVAVRNR